MSNHALQYWVRKVVRSGLLVQTRQKWRAGKALRFYRATSAHYFVPLQTIEHLTLAALLGRAEASWLSILHANFLRVVDTNRNRTVKARHLLQVEEDVKSISL